VAEWPSGRVAEWGRRIGIVLVLVAIGSAYWWGPLVLRRMQFFTVRRVEVRGTRYLASREIVRRMALGSTASVFDDLGELERRISAHGGVRSAHLSRSLPGTLVADVVEVEPVALAEGPDGLIPLAGDATPLPYDLQVAPVDVPVVRSAEAPLVSALATLQSADIGLFGDVSAARVGKNEVVLELPRGRVRLALPADPEKIRIVSIVRRDIEQHGGTWQELDGRFRGWVVVRRAMGNGQSGMEKPVTPPRASTRPPVRSRPSPVRIRRRIALRPLPIAHCPLPVSRNA
jgi:POTRA domain-containing FtsQ-type protein